MKLPQNRRRIGRIGSMGASPSRDEHPYRQPTEHCRPNVFDHLASDVWHGEDSYAAAVGEPEFIFLPSSLKGRFRAAFRLGRRPFNTYSWLRLRESLKFGR